jgi:hypothetical protein
VLGGVALLIPLLLLLKPSSVSWGAALVKAFLGNLLSGIVGGIAWELGPTVGAAVWPPFGWSQSGNYRETGFEEIELRTALRIVRISSKRTFGAE